ATVIPAAPLRGLCGDLAAPVLRVAEGLRLGEERVGAVLVTSGAGCLGHQDERLRDPELAPRLALHRERLLERCVGRVQVAAGEGLVGEVPERPGQPPAVAR